MKRRVRLTESDLHKIVKESVQSIIKENDASNYWRQLGFSEYDLMPGAQQKPQTQEVKQYKEQIRQYLLDADSYVCLALNAMYYEDYKYVTQALNKIKEILTPLYLGRI